MLLGQYSFGDLEIQGKHYQDDMIIFSDHIETWLVGDHHHPLESDFKQVLNKKADILLIGAGYSGLLSVGEELKKKLLEYFPQVYLVKTQKACELFNQWTRDKKKVIALLHLTC